MLHLRTEVSWGRCRLSQGCRDRLPEPAQRSNLTFASLFALVKDLTNSDASMAKDFSLPVRQQAFSCRQHIYWPLVCLAVQFQQLVLLLQVALCEPLTDLQRRGEFMSYSELLDQVTCMALHLLMGFFLPQTAPAQH